MSLVGKIILPADIVLAPAWWYHNEGITFDEDFFYNPLRRVEVEQRMERVLYERWGRYGLGADRDKELPVVGAVHLAAGFLVSQMLGCEVRYNENTPPQVICDERQNLEISPEAAFDSAAWKKFERLCESLKKKYGYLAGDVNWGGVLNVALDIRGQDLFMDMFDRPDAVRNFLGEIASVIERFTQTIAKETGTTSISVNRTVRHLSEPVFLHSECSHTMISVDDYRKYLLGFDEDWSRRFRPFGIHFCGRDPDRYGNVFSELGELDFLDVGWGGNVAKLRAYLPETFLNIRLSPVEMIEQDVGEVEQSIRRLVAESAKPNLTGVCCINIDEKVADDKISCIFQTVESLRKENSA